MTDPHSWEVQRASFPVSRYRSITAEIVDGVTLRVTAETENVGRVVLDLELGAQAVADNQRLELAAEVRNRINEWKERP
jgi:hypothetical protein